MNWWQSTKKTSAQGEKKTQKCGIEFEGLGRDRKDKGKITVQLQRRAIKLRGPLRQERRSGRIIKKRAILAELSKPYRNSFLLFLENRIYSETEASKRLFVKKRNTEVKIQMFCWGVCHLIPPAYNRERRIPRVFLIFRIPIGRKGG